MFDLAAIQQGLREFGLDGWLLYDFRGSNVLARRVLDLEQKPAGTRRFLYLIPATGEPSKLVHRIETAALDHLPGGKIVYLPWQELEAGVARLVAAKQPGRDGIRAPGVQPLRLAGRCRHDRACSRLRHRRGLVRRPDPAIRGDLGRRPVADAPRGREMHDRRPTTWPGA